MDGSPRKETLLYDPAPTAQRCFVYLVNPQALVPKVPYLGLGVSEDALLRSRPAEIP